MKRRKSLWRWWAKALGEKATKDDREADHIACLRTVIFFTYLITNLFIIAGVVRHWNDHYEVPGYLLQKQEEQNNETNCNIL